MRNPSGALTKKGKKKKKEEPKMLGPSVPRTYKEKSRFKSCFGDLPPAPKRLNPKALAQKQGQRKPVSFFDS